MREVNIQQQREFLVASALINAAIGFLQAADPDLLEEINFSEILEVQACVAGLVDGRLHGDLNTFHDQLVDSIDPDAIPLSVDIVGTEFQDGEWEPPWTDDNYYDSIRAGIDPGTGMPIEESDEPHPY